jgi:hypothetical protein
MSVLDGIGLKHGKGSVGCHIADGLCIVCLGLQSYAFCAHTAPSTLHF